MGCAKRRTTSARNDDIAVRFCNRESEIERRTSNARQKMRFCAASEHLEPTRPPPVPRKPRRTSRAIARRSRRYGGAMRFPWLPSARRKCDNRRDAPAAAQSEARATDPSALMIGGVFMLRTAALGARDNFANHRGTPMVPPPPLHHTTRPTQRHTPSTPPSQRSIAHPRTSRGLIFSLQTPPLGYAPLLPSPMIASVQDEPCCLLEAREQASP